MQEQWKPIPGHDGRYEVSDQGRVRSWAPWRKTSTPRMLTRTLGRRGYLTVTLSSAERRHRQTTVAVHKLVAAAFLGPCPDDQEVRHLDGNRARNVAANLAYGTKSQNALDQVRHGRHNFLRANRRRWDSRRAHLPVVTS